MPKPVIEFRDVTFTYWESARPAVQDLNVCLERGEFVLLAGPTGAGKSTFLMMLNGLIPHLLPGRLEGRVVIDGTETRSSSVAQLATRVGLVFEDPDTQIVSLTVEDDVAFGPSNLGLEVAEIRRRVAGALRRCRLVGLEGRNPLSLSGGQKQSLALAGIVAMRPQILALDEPLSMLDPIGRVQVMAILQELAEETGATIVVAEQNPEPMLALANRMLVFDRGRIVRDGRPRDVFQDTAGLAAIGVKLPPMVELFHELHGRGHLAGETPLTLDEAAGALSANLAGRRPRPSANGREAAGPGVQQPFVYLERVHHHYDDAVQALQGVDLSIARGEVIAIVGQNGCGKTTLASHLVGVLRPTNPDATIRVAGLDVPRTPYRQLLPHINYVFQNPDEQLFQESVALEIAYGLENLGVAEAEREQRVEAALARFGLQDVRDWPPKELDRGLRTKTAIASIVAMDPDILIIDEPTTGLDHRDAIAIFSVLDGLAAEGKTIIFISHEMDLVARFARRVIVMHEGKVFLDGPPALLFAEEETLQQLSLLPPEIHRLCRRLDWPLWDGLRTPADLAEAIDPYL